MTGRVKGVVISPSPRTELHNKINLMKMKKICLIILALAISAITTDAFSQNIMDALRYSYITPGGSARFMSMGSSFGALGGDFSSLSINPAGIGVYRSSEISFSPSLYHNNLSSTYYDTRNEDYRYNFNVHNLGGVFTLSIPGDNDIPGWRNINFGIGINRHNDFNFRRFTEGVNPDNSILTYWQEGGYLSDLAWDAFLTDNEDIDPYNGGLQTIQNSRTKGSIREFVLNIGANYNDRLYIGTTFGFPRVRYEEVITHEETDVENIITNLHAFSYKHNLQTTGTGFNFKFGTIYRITDMIRVGAAIHTPTFYSLTDKWTDKVESDITAGEYVGGYEDFEEGERYQSSSDASGIFDYELNTPLKAIGSLGFVFGTYGLINIDYEYIDYSNARLRSDDYAFTDENNIIKSDLRQQHVIRAGGELKLPVMQPFALRGGYALYSNPYRTDVNNTEKSIITAGFGMREENYFVDIAYMISFQNEDYYPYGSDFTQPIENEFTRNAFVLTLGYRF